MLVKDWMSTDVTWVDESTSMLETSQIMKKSKFRRLPVLKGGRLTGIISDRDIKEASPSKRTTLDVHELYYLLAKLTAGEVMTRNPITIGPGETIERAAVVLLENRISGLPVVDGANGLMGILTQGDIFRVLISITGVYRPGVKFALDLADRPGAIGEVHALLRAHGGRIHSVFTSYDLAPEGRMNVFLRTHPLPPAAIEGLSAEFQRLGVFKYLVLDEIKSI